MISPGTHALQTADHALVVSKVEFGDCAEERAESAPAKHGLEIRCRQHTAVCHIEADHPSVVAGSPKHGVGGLRVAKEVGLGCRVDVAVHEKCAAQDH